MIPSPNRLVSVFLVVLGLAAGAAAQIGSTGSTPSTFPGNTDRILYGTTYQQRLSLLWISNFEGVTVVQGKMFRPLPMHRVTTAVTGRKSPEGSKKEAKMMQIGSSSGEKAFEQLLVASYPLTVRSTFRVPERLPKQGKSLTLKEPPAPGNSVRVFCTLDGEEKTKCLATPETFDPLDQGTCQRLAEESERIDAAACEGLPEQSPIADLLTLEDLG